MAAKQQSKELNLFEQGQKLIEKGQKLLVQGLENARKEQAAIEEITKTLSVVHFSSTIKLNVGGRIYKTTLDTLRKDPDSMLSAMFSGRFELKADEEDGAYFIDRDGELFRYILNYLRDGELLYPDEQAVKKQLLKEAKFYQVQGIITQLEESKFPAEISSVIEDEKHCSVLTSWLPPGANISLLYRASSNGRSPADFHRCCDGKGPTLVVIKSEACIFGGYSSKSWESASPMGFIEDSKSFLFTLVNPTGGKPITIMPKPGAHGGIRFDGKKGPSFGTSSNYDLDVWQTFLPTSPSKATSQLDLGYGFIHPEGVNKNTYFTGKHPFEVSELEVFKIQF